MKRRKILVLFTLILLCSLQLHAQITVSGILESTVSLRAGAGEAPAFSYGVEEYANLRLQARIRDRAVFYGAFNFLAAAGDNARLLAAMGFNPIGENFIAGMELERLYFRMNWETASLDCGLFRLPFGYGRIWGPVDFLNPKNPLKPDARPRAILGGAVSWYPVDSIKLIGFGAAPRDPFSRQGSGGLSGLSLDWHWGAGGLGGPTGSIQALYSFESPQSGSNKGLHRAGVSVKADWEIALVIDALYTYNHEEKTGIEGLSFSAGADYSFFDGKLLLIAEYLYNGSASATSLRGGGSFSNTNYLYSGITWLISDLTNITAALISGFDDVSFTPLISLSHDLFQGAALSFSVQVPLDRDLFSGDGSRGELGPLPPGLAEGSYCNCSIKLRLRF